MRQHRRTLERGPCALDLATKQMRFGFSRQRVVGIVVRRDDRSERIACQRNSPVAIAGKET